MSANPIWIAAYGGPPPAAVGASAVWIAPGDGTVPSAVASYIAGYFNPVAGASPVWIAGYGGPPPAAIGATPITIVGYGGSGGGGPPPVTSVWSAADAAANGMTLSNGGLTVTPTTTAINSIRGTIGKTSGKLYFETSTSSTTTSQLVGPGLANAAFTPSTFLGNAASSCGTYLTAASYSNNFTLNYALTTTVMNANDVFGVAVDLGAGKVWVAVNNVWVGAGNPATGASPMFTFTPATVGALFPGMAFQGPGAGVWTLQSTAASQKYAPPSGFSAWDAPVAPPTSVWSAADAAANGMTLSNGGLTVTGSGSASAWASIRGSISKTSGKVYVEFLNTVAPTGGGTFGHGTANSSIDIGTYLGSSASGCASFSSGAMYGNNFTRLVVAGDLVINRIAVGDVYAVAIDFSASLLWIGSNNNWIGGGDPGQGTIPTYSFTPATVGALFPAMSLIDAAGSWTLQSTAASQKYAPPSGFSAWDSAAPVVTGHRYWRLDMTATAGTAYSMAEVQFRTTAGTPLLFSGGTASASSFYDGTTTADKATDNDPSTEWSSTTALAKLSPNTWMYDYGVGKALSVVEIMMQARSGYFNQTPTVFTPQWSDDGVSWTSMAQIATAPWTTDGQIQTFPVQTPSQAYLARTVGGNEGGNGANIATLIDGLVSDGVWAKLDCLYVLAQQNETDAKLNLIGTSYGLTQVGTIRLRPTPAPNIGTLIFTPSRGFAGFNTVSSYLSTGFNASVAPSPQFTQNSASFGVWSLGGVGNEVASQIGTSLFAEAGESHIYNSFTDGNFYPRINNGSVGGVLSPGSTGFFAADRPSSATVVPYSNGAALASQSAASQAPNNRVFTIGYAANETGVRGTAQTLSAAHIGASLGAAGQLALYNRLRTYMTAIGVP